MAAPLVWEQLSQSSKTALQWAAALAMLRLGDDGTTLAPLDADDLLVGLVLSHPRGGEAGTLIDHFGFGLRPVLDPNYPDIDVDRLAVAAERISPDAPPAVADDAEAVLGIGVDLGLSTGSEQVAELAAIVGGLLHASTPTTTRLHSLIGDAGVDVTELQRAFEEHLKAGSGSGSMQIGDLGTMLRRRFPRRPVTIPDYKADRVDLRGDGPDLLGIQAEVDAFAYLLASRGLSPPLAVGLFGDWGSGKSFYMRSIRRRIEQLTGRKEARRNPQGQLGFWKNIVQIDFNAWHYVEGSLWASLVEHIFTHLATSGDEPPSVLADRRREVFNKLESTARERTLAVQRREQVQQDLKARRQKAREARNRRDQQRRRLEQEQAKVLDRRLQDDIKKEIAGLLGKGERSVLPPAADLVAALDETHDLLLQGRSLLGPFWSSGWRVSAMIGATAAVPAVVLASQALEAAIPVQLASGLAATMAYLSGVVGAANRHLRRRLDRIATIRAEVEQARVAAEQQLDQVVAAAQQAVDDAQEEVARAERAEEALRKEADRLDTELATLTPTRVLTDFVAERAGADDYRRHLGVAALIRKDFEQLADLIREHNQSVVDGAEDRLGINRIILYIDDLDRCPSEQVVEVLQAVHLLLAFDLFVVVVAVDSRWLSDALIDRHPALVAQAAHGHATPQNYLEKIFQLPFWVQPLGAGGRRALVRGLLEPNLSKPEPSGQQDQVGELRLDEERRAALTELLSREGRPHLRAETLNITPDELAFLDSLAPLLGDTPRAVKRFVNVYQLLAAMPAIARAQDQHPSERSLAAFLAAVNEAAPRFTSNLFEAMNGPDQAATLGSLLDSATASLKGERRRLAPWFEDHPDWKAVPVARFAPLASLVRRLSFRTPA